MDDYYQMPWIRVTPFTMGLLLGMAQRDKRLHALRLSDSAAAAAMFSCVGTMVFLFYIQVRTRASPETILAHCGRLARCKRCSFAL